MAFGSPGFGSEQAEIPAVFLKMGKFFGTLISMVITIGLYASMFGCGMPLDLYY